MIVAIKELGTSLAFCAPGLREDVLADVEVPDGSRLEWISGSTSAALAPLKVYGIGTLEPGRRLLLVVPTDDDRDRLAWTAEDVFCAAVDGDRRFKVLAGGRG